MRWGHHVRDDDTQRREGLCYFRYFIYWCKVMINTSNYELVASLRGNRISATTEIIDFMVDHYDRAIRHAYRSGDKIYSAHCASIAAERKGDLLLQCGRWHDVAEAYRDAAWYAMNGNVVRNGHRPAQARRLVERATELLATVRAMEPDDTPF